MCARDGQICLPLSSRERVVGAILYTRETMRVYIRPGQGNPHGRASCEDRWNRDTRVKGPPARQCLRAKGAP